MRRRRSSRAAVVALALLASSVLTVAAPATVGASARSQKLSNEACDGFADYFTIEFLVAFASAFAGLGGESAKAEDGSTVTPDDIANTFHLIFSPKLEKITGTLAAESPKSIRKLFARQHDVFAQGVDMLGELGLTKRQLEVLSELDLSPNTNVEDLLGEVKVSQAKLRRAAEDFGEIAGALDLNDSTTRAQQRAFQQTGTRCGVFPESDLDCESLVGTELSAPLVGGDPTVENDQGSCTYTGPAGADGDEPVMIVDVYPSPRTFDRLVDALPNAEQVGDAYVADGFSSFSSTKTCGKTLYSQDGGDTIVVALCPPGDGAVDADDLVQVRDAVVDARSILSRRSG